MHLGAAVSTIDLAREVSPTDLTAAEAEANRVVWDNRLVSVHYAGAEEAVAMGLRRESHRSEMLRIVEIEQFDVSACGGSHGRRGVRLDQTTCPRSGEDCVSAA